MALFNSVETNTMDLGLPRFWTRKNSMFWKLDLFSSIGDGWETPPLLGLLESANLNHLSSYLKVKVTLRLTVSQSVSQSWCQAPLEAHDQILVLVWVVMVSSLLGVLSDETMGLALVSCHSQLRHLFRPSLSKFYVRNFAIVHVLYIGHYLQYSKTWL
jgi:hypothetical protein